MGEVSPLNLSPHEDSSCLTLDRGPGNVNLCKLGTTKKREVGIRNKRSCNRGNRCWGRRRWRNRPTTEGSRGRTSTGSHSGTRSTCSSWCTTSCTTTGTSRTSSGTCGRFCCRCTHPVPSLPRGPRKGTLGTRGGDLAHWLEPV